MKYITQIQELRKRTSASIIDCKKALLATDGNLELAIDWLRSHGFSKALTKLDRLTGDGLVAIEIVNKLGVILEINSETDFVAKNEKFKGLANAIIKVAVNCEDLLSLKNKVMPSGKTVDQEILSYISIMGENIKLSKMEVLKVNEGVIASYIHNSVASNLGKIAVILSLESEADKSSLLELGKKLAIHIAATNPRSIDVKDLDQCFLNKERDLLLKQLSKLGKSNTIIDKIIEGKIEKLYEEVVLLKQDFVMDNKIKILELIDNTANKVKYPISLTGFIRYEVGKESY